MTKNKQKNSNDNTEVVNKNVKIKKVFSVLATVLTVIIFIFTLFVVVNAVIAKVQNRPVKFFGYSFAIVLTNSMEPEIMTGDLIMFKECNVSDVKIGNDIVFIAGNSFDEAVRGQSVVHRVIELVYGADGSSVTGFVTKGINNVAADNDSVTADNLLGICTYNSTALGKIVLFFIHYGVLVLVALIALPFIVKQVIKIVKLVKEQKSNEGEQDNSDKNSDDKS
jgi:signal peptidase I